jgi:hypothetical protein
VLPGRNRALQKGDDQVWYRDWRVKVGNPFRNIFDLVNTEFVSLVGGRSGFEGCRVIGFRGLVLRCVRRGIRIRREGISTFASGFGKPAENLTSVGFVPSIGIVKVIGESH